ncbi:MAG TPA: tetratricopeptide repeat protein [Rhizomicrobium sp.]|nr:tetratricopeptide repeat protein [Rhizomicrobium sp.]
MFYGFGLITLLAQMACAAHIIRTGRHYFWIVPVLLLPWIGIAAYVVYSLLSGAAQNYAVRRFADDTPNITDPGTSYRQKKRDLEMVGSAQAKRVFAEECIKRGRFQDAVDLYQSAAQGTFAQDPALLHGLARAKLLVGDGAGSEAAFLALKAADPAAFTQDAHLDYARALALQGKNEQAAAEYEKLARVYPGEEARCRYAVLLKEMGQNDKAQSLFRAIVDAVKSSPSYVRRRQREWLRIARQNLN